MGIAAVVAQLPRQSQAVTLKERSLEDWRLIDVLNGGAVSVTVVPSSTTKSTRATRALSSTRATRSALWVVVSTEPCALIVGGALSGPATVTTPLCVRRPTKSSANAVYAKPSAHEA